MIPRLKDVPDDVEAKYADVGPMLSVKADDIWETASCREELLDRIYIEPGKIRIGFTNPSYNDEATRTIFNGTVIPLLLLSSAPSYRWKSITPRWAEWEHNHLLVPNVDHPQLLHFALGGLRQARVWADLGLAQYFDLQQHWESSGTAGPLYRRLIRNLETTRCVYYSPKHLGYLLYRQGRGVWGADTWGETHHYRWESVGPEAMIYQYRPYFDSKKAPVTYLENY